MKYKQQEKETQRNFVSRIVNTEDRPMTVNEVYDLIQKRNRNTKLNIHASLSDAVKHGSLSKTMIEDTEGKRRVHYHPITQQPMGEDIPIPAYQHRHKMNAIKDFGEWKHDKWDDDEWDDDEYHEPNLRVAVVSTIQHHFTAEQLLDTLNNLNPDLHDDVIVAIFDALGKNKYSPLHHDFNKPQPRKTAFMSWAFVGGNLVVKE
jgi:hypothetical protein